MNRSIHPFAPVRVLPIHREIPADLLTPVAAFLRLRKLGHAAFLLESVEGGERLARYSFLGVKPQESLKIQDGELVIGGQVHPGPPLKRLGDYLSRFRREGASEGLPPFSGGVVGYLGYEAIQHLEKSVPARPGDSPDARFLLFKNVIAFDHVRQRVILISNVFIEEEGRKGIARAQRDLDQLEKAIAKPSSEETPLPKLPQSPAFEREPMPAGIRGARGKAGFVQAVKTLKRHIRQGDIFQCVLSEQFRFPLRADPFQVYRCLRNTSPAPYLYYLAFDREETLLGASPEMLVRVSAKGRMETSPIAGTRPRGRVEKEDAQLEKNLLGSVKERAEHLMLVDLGRNDLGKIAKPGSVRVREFMQLHRFSHVMHLVSLVEAKLRSRERAWSALLSCFPAGTLSGAPKVRAMQLIAEHEPVARGPYGGAVVYHDFGGSLDSCITIRSLHVNEGVATLQAGAGVVADSRPESEYAEVLNKTRAMRRAVVWAEGGSK